MTERVTNRYLTSLIILLFINFFNTSSKFIPQLIANLSFVLVFGISILVFLLTIAKRITMRQLIIFFILSMLLLFLLINIGIDILQALKTIFQLIYIIIFVFSISRMDIKYLNIRFYKKINIFIAFLLYCFYTIRIVGYDIMFHNIASLAHISYGMFFFNYLIYRSETGKIRLTNSLVYIPLLILSRGRNMMLTFIVTLIIYKLWNIICKTKLRRLLTFSTVVGVIYTVTVEYPKWYYDQRFLIIDQRIRNITGKSFFSGRQVIWRNIISFMEDDKWLGHGTGTLYRFFLDDNRSAHNQYLQLYMQNGILGIIILVIVLLILWLSISEISYDSDESIRQRSRICGSFLLTFMFFNTFTVGMLQNSMATALLMWFIVALGLYKNKNRLIKS